MTNKKISKIHFVGIKGVGMAPLAIIAKEAGFEVSGCDIDEEFITDEPLKRSGIVPLIGFFSDHVRNIDLVITTGAHGGFDNIEVKNAREKNIKVLTQGEAVGVFMDGSLLGRSDIKGISVAGSHGKTTTTGIIATILNENGNDPSFVIGTGNVPSLGSPGHYGKGEYFVAEADEYATEPVYDKTPKFLWQHPKIAVITNIELDHPDLFLSIKEVEDAFLKFANSLSSDSTLFVNADDSSIQKILGNIKNNVVTFGANKQNNYVLNNVKIQGPKTWFTVGKDNKNLGTFMLNVIGEHNARNALAALVIGLKCGLSLKGIVKGLLAFKGSKRRSEFVGRLKSGALLFDDYAHHPTEIKKTLLAFRKSYPNHKIVCIFQPHTYSRTKKLFDQFIRSFNASDTTILTNIYPSLREQPDPTVSSKKMVQAMNTFNAHSIFLPDLQDVVEYIDRKRLGPDTLIITMGAGDVYKISEKLKVQN